MNKIGFVGLGTMGMPMATRLIEAGYIVYPMDIDPMATKKMVSKGGKNVASYSELSKLVQVIAFSLPNSKIIESSQ
jgi:3-hydroxyisobutyrate dehydrogenase